MGGVHDGDEEDEEAEHDVDHEDDSDACFFVFEVAEFHEGWVIRRGRGVRRWWFAGASGG